MAKKKVKKNKQRKSKGKIKTILLIMILLVVGICAYLLLSPQFDIQQISITGNNKLSRQQIMAFSEIQLGDNIFSKFAIVMKVKLKQNGYIKDVEINKIYPNKIEINVTERKAQFQIKTETESYIYIDEQGYILEAAMNKLEVPTIIGMDIKTNDLGTLHRLEEKDLNKMENILQIREQFKTIDMAEKITQIQVDNEYVINLENDGLMINLGNAANLKDRMDYVRALLKQEAGNKGTLYVNGNLNEGFLPYFSAN